MKKQMSDSSAELILQVVGFLLLGCFASLNYSFPLSVVLCVTLVVWVLRNATIPKVKPFGWISASAALIPFVYTVIYWTINRYTWLIYFRGRSGGMFHGSNLYFWEDLWYSIAKILCPMTGQ